MSSDYLDYEENLAFEPGKVTMPRCDIETLKNEIKHLKDLQANQDKYVEELTQEKEKLLRLYNKQITELQIAINTLEKYADMNAWSNCRCDDGYLRINGCYKTGGYGLAQKALAKIKE